jgi:hypothetical protein
MQFIRPNITFSISSTAYTFVIAKIARRIDTYKLFPVILYIVVRENQRIAEFAYRSLHSLLPLAVAKAIIFQRKMEVTAT